MSTVPTSPKSSSDSRLASTQPVTAYSTCDETLSIRFHFMVRAVRNFRLGSSAISVVTDYWALSMGMTFTPMARDFILGEPL